ncbi:SUMO protein smt3 [Vanrija albida]|uniref:SUMO protein smt3 n=1 Tax=Vanrija albida TaxID=181172 RepID=A0ABR3Q489_9TREE
MSSPAAIKDELVIAAYKERNDPGTQPREEGGTQDIKPKIDDLTTNHIGFNPTKRVPKSKGPLKPNQFRIRLCGTKEGQPYSIKLLRFPHHTGLDIKMDKIRIIYDGAIVKNDQTMNDLEVEDLDEFDVYVEQIGGSARPEQGAC